VSVFYIPPENIGSLGRLPSDQQFTGALDSLPLDEMQNPPLQLAGMGRRAFLKGLAAVAGAGATRKLPIDKIDEVAPVAKKMKLSLPKSLFDLPALRKQTDDYIDMEFENNIYQLEDDEISEIMKGYYTNKELKSFGIDPKEITAEDLLNPNVFDELKNDMELNPSAATDDVSIFEDMQEEMLDYLTGKLEIGDLDSTDPTGAYSVVKSLTEDYGLDREGIANYIRESLSDTTQTSLREASKRWNRSETSD